MTLNLAKPNDVDDSIDADRRYGDYILPEDKRTWRIAKAAIRAHQGNKNAPSYGVKGDYAYKDDVTLSVITAENFSDGSVTYKFCELRNRHWLFGGGVAGHYLGQVHIREDANVPAADQLWIQMA